MNKLPWMMMQEWFDIFFIHFPIEYTDIWGFVPAELEIDTFEGKAWISFVYFKTKNTRARFTPPLPGISSFYELNVRTYVKYKKRSGVYFLNLDVNNKLMAKLPRIGGYLPFRYASITSRKDQDTVTFQSRYEREGKTPQVIRATVKVMPNKITRTPLEYFLTERHYLWTKVMGKLVRQYNGHTPWILQRATCTIHENSMVPSVMKKGQESQPLAHYSTYKKAFLYIPVRET